MVPRSPRWGPWRGLSQEGPVGQGTHPWCTKGHLSPGTQPSWDSPLGPGLHVAHAAPGCHPTHPQSRPSCRAKWKSLHRDTERHPYHIGKRPRSLHSPPLGSASFRIYYGSPQPLAKTMGAILGWMDYLKFWPGLVPGEQEALPSTRPS
jgi:hypothetical protein